MRFINRFACFLAPLLFFPLHLLSQSDGTIHGVVLAGADGSRLSASAVTLREETSSESRDLVTGGDGHFVFQRLTPGDYVLTARHDGFLDRSYRLTLRPRESQNVVLELRLRPVEQAVEVTADLTSIATTHSPSSTLLSAGRIERLPLPQRSSLTDVVVTAAPGMIRGHDDFVHVRGSEIALNPFINGVSFWENAHSIFPCL
jgi:hypothetical protein